MIKERNPTILKILLFLESARTGVGRHVVDLAFELIRRNHQVHVIHSSTNIDSRFIDNAKRLAQAGCRVVGRDMRHAGHPSDLALILWLRRYIQHQGPFDVVHCHSSKAGFIGRLAAVGTRSRVFYTPHAFFTMKPGLPRPVRWAVAAIEAGLSRLSDRVIAVSDEESNHGHNIGIPPNRLTTILNGTTILRKESIDAIRQRVRNSFGIPQDALGIGFIGRLSHQKAPDHLLTSFAVLKKNFNVPQARLLIVGDGPLQKNLQNQCTQLRLDDSIHWMGDTNGEEAVCAFDIFVLSSDYEGLPYVVLEAMSAGNPIVTTDVGGMRALVIPGVNGYVVPCRDVPALASAMGELTVDAELRTRMGSASSEHVKLFSAEKMAENTLNLYLS